MAGFEHPFPGKVPHQPDEPAYGLLLRTLEHNGARLVHAMFNRAAGGARASVTRLDPVEIARICKADASTVTRATPIVGEAIVMIFGQALAAEQFSVDHRRWCPACLDESPHHRVWWDVSAITSCPFHGVELSSGCGCPRRPLRWHNNPLLSCRRGHDLRRVDRTPAAPDVSAFDRYVVERLLGQGGRGAPDLGGLALGELLVVCERLGLASLGVDRSTFDLRREFPAGRLHAEGFRVLRDAAAFDDLLDRVMLGAGDRAGRTGVMKAYGEFYNWVRNLPDDGPCARLKRSLAEHARRNIVLKTGTRLDGRERVVPDGVAVSEAAHGCGMAYVRFRRLLQRLGVPIAGGGPGRRAEIARADYDGLAARLKGFRILKEVASDLAMSLTDVADAARAGHVEAIVLGEGTADWVFPEHAAGKLLSTLRGKASRTAEATPDLLPLHGAAVASGVSVVDVLGLILADRLAVTVDAAAEGVDTFRVDARSLASLVVASDGMAIGIAARRLGLTQGGMDAVLAAGLLRTIDAAGRRRVDPAEIARFKQEWVTVTQLREAMGVGSLQPVVSALAAAGVPAAVAGAGKGDLVYRREPAMLACRRDAAPTDVAVARGRNRNDIAARLGMTPRMLRQLVDADLIAMQPGCRHGSIADAEVDRFDREFTTSTGLRSAFGVEGWNTVGAILAKAGVTPVRQPPAFEAYLYRRAEALEALEAHAEARRLSAERAASQAEPALTLDEVSARLGVVKNMALQLTQKNILRSARVGRFIMVPVTEVERFARDFVLGNELGDLAGRTEHRGTGAAVTRALLKGGLAPICSRPEFYSYVFDREQALAAMRRLGLLKPSDRAA